jgi:hypothetical protein
MVWIDDRWGMNTKEAIKAFNKMAECAHAYGYSTLATGNYSHAEGSSNSLREVEPLHIASSLREEQTTEVDVLEKVRREIEEWMGDPSTYCQWILPNLDDRGAE